MKISNQNIDSVAIQGGSKGTMLLNVVGTKCHVDVDSVTIQGDVRAPGIVNVLGGC